MGPPPNEAAFTAKAKYDSQPGGMVSTDQHPVSVEEFFPEDVIIHKKFSKYKTTTMEVTEKTYLGPAGQ